MGVSKAREKKKARRPYPAPVETEEKPGGLRELLKVVESLSGRKGVCVSSRVWRVLSMEEQRTYLAGLNDCLCAVTRGKCRFKMQSLVTCENVLRRPDKVIPRMLDSIHECARKLILVDMEEKHETAPLESDLEDPDIALVNETPTFGAVPVLDSDEVTVGLDETQKCEEEIGEKEELTHISEEEVVEDRLEVERVEVETVPDEPVAEIEGLVVLSPMHATTTEKSLDVDEEIEEVDEVVALAPETASEAGPPAEISEREDRDVAPNADSSEPTSTAEYFHVDKGVAEKLDDEGEEPEVDEQRKKGATTKTKEDSRDLWKFGLTREFLQVPLSETEEGKHKLMLRRAARMTRENVRFKGGDELYELRVNHSGFIRDRRAMEAYIQSPTVASSKSLPCLPVIVPAVVQVDAVSQVKELQLAFRPPTPKKKAAENPIGEKKMDFTSLMSGPTKIAAPYPKDTEREEREEEECDDRDTVVQCLLSEHDEIPEVDGVPEDIIKFLRYVKLEHDGNIQRVFRMIDGNGNETVSTSEFVQAIQTMKFADKTNSKSARHTFQFLNKSKNGMLTFGEMRDVLNRAEKKLLEYEKLSRKKAASQQGLPGILTDDATVHAMKRRFGFAVQPKVKISKEKRASICGQSPDSTLQSFKS